MAKSGVLRDSCRNFTGQGSVGGDGPRDVVGAFGCYVDAEVEEFRKPDAVR